MLLLPSALQVALLERAAAPVSCLTAAWLCVRKVQKVVLSMLAVPQGIAGAHHTLEASRSCFSVWSLFRAGGGVQVCRTLGTPALRNLDPFLMLDEMRMPARSASKGFPSHPHRGTQHLCVISPSRERTRL